MVVKPQDGNQGKGVTVNITTRAQLEAAYATALAYGSQVMVERFLPGHDFRLLVVGNQLVAAARRDPPQVLGDGVHSVAQLVEHGKPRPAPGQWPWHGADQDPPGRHRHRALGQRRADARVSVPAQGQRVVLRNNANLSTGGSATDVTDDVHPTIAARAIEAAASHWAAHLRRGRDCRIHAQAPGGPGRRHR